MNAAADYEHVLGPELSAALARRGYSQLTAVQCAVLEPGLEGRDLRITSQTGSGKTLAIGFALRECMRAPATAAPVAQPCALVVAPTRELALQMQLELQWLYADCELRVVAITGGASYREEHRALARGARLIVVGTPGRLLDHLDRGSIDASAVGAVVLDEADRLLDMGFRDDLERIFAHTPEQRRTHLVSATFPRAVRALADKVQPLPALVQGSEPGVANSDIEHVIHVVEPDQRLDAIINLLLASPELQTLVFARTRADVAGITAALCEAGFAAGSLSGELDQTARNRALSGFRSGRMAVMIATDVAARGIDVQDIARVIHAEPPSGAVEYTHRSGRTGRAGRKGRSCLLVTRAQAGAAARLLKAAEIPHRFEPVPSAGSIRRAYDERTVASLTEVPAEGLGADEGRLRALARRLLASGDSELIVARLLLQNVDMGPRPREIRQVAPPPRTEQRKPPFGRRAAGPASQPERGGRGRFAPARPGRTPGATTQTQGAARAQGGTRTQGATTQQGHARSPAQHGRHAPKRRG